MAEQEQFPEGSATFAEMFRNWGAIAPEAVTLLSRRFYNRIYAVCRRKLPDDLAHDATNRTLLSLSKSLKKSKFDRENQTFTQYFTKAAMYEVGHVLDEMDPNRRRRRRRRAQGEVVESEADAGPRVVSSEVDSLEGALESSFAEDYRETAIDVTKAKMRITHPVHMQILDRTVFGEMTDAEAMADMKWQHSQRKYYRMKLEGRIVFEAELRLRLEEGPGFQ